MASRNETLEEAARVIEKVMEITLSTTIAGVKYVVPRKNGNPSSNDFTAGTAHGVGKGNGMDDCAGNCHPCEHSVNLVCGKTYTVQRRERPGSSGPKYKAAQRMPRGWKALAR